MLKDEQLCGGAPQGIVAKILRGKEDSVNLRPHVQLDIAGDLRAPAFDDRAFVRLGRGRYRDGLVDQAGVLDDGRLCADLTNGRFLNWRRSEK